jgi:hypothetical protein
MSGYRLHIDIPLGSNEEEAIQIASQMVSTLSTHVRNRSKIDSCIEGMNYRLGHDDDRQKSNYLLKNEEGHVNNKKIRLTFNKETV